MEKVPLEYLRGNKDFIVTRNGQEEISGAAILLFGKNPQRFFQRARVRFIRYEGTEARVGTEMNVVKDVIFEGKVLDMVRKATEFVKGQIREYTFLGQDGRFVTIPEPEYRTVEFMLYATLKNHKWVEEHRASTTTTIFEEINDTPVVYHWKYRLDEISPNEEAQVETLSLEKSS